MREVIDQLDESHHAMIWTMARYFYDYENCSNCSFFYKLKRDYDYWRNTFELNPTGCDSGLDPTAMVNLRSLERIFKKRKIIKRKNDN